GRRIHGDAHNDEQFSKQYGSVHSFQRFTSGRCPLACGYPCPMTERGILFVHAHPDDETVGTGATIAHYAARPDTRVTVVTCTLGEEGEVRVPELAMLAAAEADQLGGFRYWEYRHAAEALGLTDTVFLGGVGRWRDSGMMGLPTNDHPRAFWRAEVDEAAADLVRVLRDRRPEVLVTSDRKSGVEGQT